MPRAALTEVTRLRREPEHAPLLVHAIDVYYEGDDNPRQQCRSRRRFVLQVRHHRCIVHDSRIRSTVSTAQ
jgi:hypothetical protein